MKTTSCSITAPAVALSIALSLCACGTSSTYSQPVKSVTAGSPGSVAFADQEAVRAQEAQLIKVEITVTAPVKKLLPDDTRGLPHQKFLIELHNGTTILIAHDTKMAPHVPLSVGDTPTIHGEYIWNQKGGLIHWTHHTDTPRHEGGWIDFNGARYQ
jgi:hypothetical protein